MAVGEFLYLNVEHNPNDNMDNAQIVVKVNYIPLGQPVEVPQLYGYFVFNDIKELQALKDALEDLAMIQRDRQGNFTSTPWNCSMVDILLKSPIVLHLQLFVKQHLLFVMTLIVKMM